MYIKICSLSTLPRLILKNSKNQNSINIQMRKNGAEHAWRIYCLIAAFPSH